MKRADDLPFIHPSYANERGLSEDNQRLEFLGDAVVNCYVSDRLFRAHPERDEGFLSRCKAQLVSGEHLAAKARDLALNDKILLGVGEEKTGGRSKNGILADAFEAYVGWLYLKNGFKSVCRKLDGWFSGDFDRERVSGMIACDAKSALQVTVQGRGEGVPRYRTREAGGPAHERIFESEVYVKGEKVGSGAGSSKKEAEQEAAKMALQTMEEE